MAHPMVIENKILINQCHEGDIISIDCKSLNRGWKSIYSVKLKKIKRLPKGKVQIKYQGSYKGDTVQKIDLDASTLVSRSRLTTPSDPPETHIHPRETAVVDGIKYEDTSGKGQLLERLDKLQNDYLDGSMQRRNVSIAIRDLDPLMGAMLALGLGSIGGSIHPLIQDSEFSDRKEADTFLKDLGLWTE